MAGDEIEEVTIRFDLRNWNPHLYDKMLEAVRTAGCGLRWSPDGPDVSTTLPEFLDALSRTEAAQFVRDPDAFLSSIKQPGTVATGPITMK
jgi:hypothetical protein